MLVFIFYTYDFLGITIIFSFRKKISNEHETGYEQTIQKLKNRHKQFFMLTIDNNPFLSCSIRFLAACSFLSLR